MRATIAQHSSSGLLAAVQVFWTCIVYGDFPKLGVPFGGPHNKDYSILGSILGSPHFGKLPYRDLTASGAVYGR